MPQVSVLMPAFNAGAFLRDALDSLERQTLQDYELIVIDDGSTDDTLDILTEYARGDERLRVSRNSSNLGYLETWNRAIAQAAGRYITFLDADDVCEPDRLERLHGFLEREGALAICGSAIRLINQRGETTGLKQYPTEWKGIQEDLLQESRFPFCGSAVMIRRRVYETVGGYREFFDRVGWEDHDWLLRCCEFFKAGNLAEPLYGYREHSSSITRAIGPADVRKLTIRRIGLDLARQRARDGADCLMTGDTMALRAIIDQHERPYVDDPSRVYRVLAGRARERSDWRGWWRMAQSAVARRPHELRNVKLLLDGLRTVLGYALFGRDSEHAGIVTQWGVGVDDRRTPSRVGRPRRAGDCVKRD